MADFSFTEDQKAAATAILGFFADVSSKFFVLEGFSGVGKSTMLNKLFSELRDYMKTCRLIDPNHPGEFVEVAFTATTNKAAEALNAATGQEVKTIFSALGLRVNTDYKTGNSTLVGDKHSPMPADIIVVDEASYVDSELLKIIMDRAKATKYCKVLFVGDPAQLIPVKYSYAPVFAAGFPTVRMEQVVRQAAGNPIIELSAMLRNTLKTGRFGQVIPDGDRIQVVPQEKLEDTLDHLFKSGGTNNRVLAWRNKTVMDYNNHVSNKLKGRQQFIKGEYAQVNSFVGGKTPLKNDDVVLIESVQSNVNRLGEEGTFYFIKGKRFFCPNNFKAHAQLLKEYRAQNDLKVICELMEDWVDLRPVYAQTINKSQGSTYENVLIDLSDVSKCNSGAQIARMLYVAVSRAKERVYLYGDL